MFLKQHIITSRDTEDWSNDAEIIKQLNRYSHRNRLQVIALIFDCVFDQMQSMKTLRNTSLVLNSC